MNVGFCICRRESSKIKLKTRRLYKHMMSSSHIFISFLFVKMYVNQKNDCI